MSGPELARFPRVAVKRVAELGTGHTPSRGVSEYWVNCTIPWLTLADVGPLRDGTLSVVTETKEKISSLGVANSSAVIHPAGTVVMSRTASVGFSAILGRDMATSQDYVTWRCGPQIDPRFLLHSLRGLRNEILASRMGSTHQTIYMPDVERIRVPLPPIDQQRRIADFLDAETSRIDALIAAKQQMIERLVDRDAAALASWWLRLADRFGTSALRRFGAVVEQGWSPACDAEPAAPSDWGVLKTSAVTTNSFDATQNKRLPIEIQPDLRWKVEAGDLLMVRGSGSRRAVGAVVVADPGCRLLTISDLIYRIRGLRGPAEFHATALRSAPVRSVIGSTFRTDSGQTLKLRSDDIRDLPHPAVPVERMIESLTDLHQRTGPSKDLSATLTRQIELLRERRQALITAAVSGELAV